MLNIKNLKVALRFSDLDIRRAIACKLNIKKDNIIKYIIQKKAIDARKKEDIFFVVNLYVDIKGSYKKSQDVTVENPKEKIVIKKVDKKEKIIIVGTGPAGLFAGLTLAYAGLNPILIERGKDVDSRTVDVENLFENGVLDEESNVLFGEGGAGTFSDGKLTTNIRSDKIQMVLDEFILAGAPEEIAYLSKPHIGTDILKTTIKNIRNKIIDLGGKVYFNKMLTDIDIKEGKIKGVLLKTFNGCEYVSCDKLILAIGHSARDTFKMLYDKSLSMEQKPFSMGVRIEQKQEVINASQYGEDNKNNPYLTPASYKLATHLKNGRSVYTFCMCPGGLVIPAMNERKQINVNGMSYYKRDLENANSALLVNVLTSDFGSSHPLEGINMQRKYEHLAYQLTNSYRAPSMTVYDFLHGTLTGFREVTPSYKPGVVNADITKCLPKFVSDSLKEGILEFNKKIRNFASDGAILTAIETRSSSPVRIIRDDSMQSNIKGIFPIGEGAGYAGGITSAAVDGINAALKIIEGKDENE